MRILVGTDLSERSQAALTRAMQLANTAEPPITLVHVVDGDLPLEVLTAHRDRARAWLASHPQADARTHSIDVLVRTGDPHVELLAAAEELQVDLVILGAHRRRLLRDAFIGTTAERLLRISTKPVLIVHNASAAPYTRVLASTDLSDISAGALITARDLGFLPRDTTLVHVFHAPAGSKLQQVGLDPVAHTESERQRAALALDRFLQRSGLGALKPRIQLREGRAAHQIHMLVEEMTPDLLVLGTKGLTGIRRAAVGSITERLLRTVPCDVLAVPPSTGR